jgi:hypothetical protein
MYPLKVDERTPYRGETASSPTESPLSARYNEIVSASTSSGSEFLSGSSRQFACVPNSALHLAFSLIRRDGWCLWITPVTARPLEVPLEVAMLHDLSRLGVRRAPCSSFSFVAACDQPW